MNLILRAPLEITLTPELHLLFLVFVFRNALSFLLSKISLIGPFRPLGKLTKTLMRRGLESSPDTGAVDTDFQDSYDNCIIEHSGSVEGNKT